MEDLKCDAFISYNYQYFRKFIKIIKKRQHDMDVYMKHMPRQLGRTFYYIINVVIPSSWNRVSFVLVWPSSSTDPFVYIFQNSRYFLPMSSLDREHSKGKGSVEGDATNHVMQGTWAESVVLPSVKKVNCALK